MSGVQLATGCLCRAVIRDEGQTACSAGNRRPGGDACLFCVAD